MKTITSHLLDTVQGLPAQQVALALHSPEGHLLAWTTTGRDGRASLHSDGPLPPGVYRIVLQIGDYFDRQGIRYLYPEITIAFNVSPDMQRLHLPVLIGPYSYSTYRGS